MISKHQAILSLLLGNHVSQHPPWNGGILIGTWAENGITDQQQSIAELTTATKNCSQPESRRQHAINTCGASLAIGRATDAISRPQARSL